MPSVAVERRRHDVVGAARVVILHLFLFLDDSRQGVVACTSFLMSRGVLGEDCFKNNGKTATDRHT